MCVWGGGNSKLFENILHVHTYVQRSALLKDYYFSKLRETMKKLLIFNYFRRFSSESRSNDISEWTKIDLIAIQINVPVTFFSKKFSPSLQIHLVVPLITSYTRRAQSFLPALVSGVIRSSYVQMKIKERLAAERVRETGGSWQTKKRGKREHAEKRVKRAKNDCTVSRM